MAVLNRSELIELVEKTLPFTSDSAVLPILTHLALKDGSISAFNDIQGIEIDTEDFKGLNCAVPGAALLRILKTVDSPNIELNANKNKNSLNIKFGRNKTNLAILPDEDFIYEFPKVKEPQTLHLTSTFIDAARLCLTSVADVPGHPELNTLSIIIEGKDVSLYSTDNKTMSRVTFQLAEAPGNIKLIVPAPFFSQLISLSASEGEVLELNFNETLMSVDFGNEIKISTSLALSTSFIDFVEIFNSQIPDMERVVLTESPPGLQNALERAAVFSEVQSQKFVNIDIKDSAAYLKSQSSLGNTDDIIEFGTDLGEFAFTIDPVIMAKAVSRTSEISLLPNLLIARKKTANLDFIHLVSYAT